MIPGARAIAGHLVHGRAHAELARRGVVVVRAKCSACFARNYYARTVRRVFAAPTFEAGCRCGFAQLVEVTLGGA